MSEPAPSDPQLAAPPTRVLVTLCTYNERENLADLIAEIHRFAPHADLLVVDDNSPDGTGALADELAARDPRVKVLHRPEKRGLGVATVAGFRYALEHGYELVLNMDADFSHPPSVIPALLEAAAHADVAVASRYVPGGGVEGWGLQRHLMSRAINAYARLLLGLRTRDNSGSFRCYRASALRRVELDRIRATGYAIQEELLYRCRQAGCTFAEVPFVFRDRTRGVSKISISDGLRSLWVLATLRMKS